jgi:hypothetical protein
MKIQLYTFLFSLILLGCGHKEEKKTYIPRTITANESFNTYEHDKEQRVLSVQQYGDSSSVSKKEDEQEDKFSVKFGDTTVRIQTNASDPKATADRFAFAQFVNTQKTCLLVQVADRSGLVAPFYVIALKDGKLDVVRIYRPSGGSQDSRFTKGLSRIGRSGYLINNDFFITSVDAKVYLIKRQNPAERIQGLHFINSPDKQTLVFLVSSSLYEVYYPTGETFTQPISLKAPKRAADLYRWVQDNYSWQKNKEGISFLKTNIDDNRIIDIKEFKKKP